MIVNLIGILLFVLYQSCILLSSIRLTFLIANRGKITISTGESIVLWILIGIGISSTFGGVFSFLKFNGQYQYVLASLLLLISLHIERRLDIQSYRSYFSNIISSFYRDAINWKMLAIMCLVLPLVFANMRPIDETDSLFTLNFILNWISNNSTPYNMINNDNSFWELSYVPSMVITHTDDFLWLTSLQAILVIGIGIYLVTREINLPKILGILTSLSCFFFFLLWIHNPSGAGTIKPDMIYAAGLIILVLASLKILRGNLSKESAILLILGASFSIIKYSGIAIVFFTLIILFLFHGKKIASKGKKLVLWALLFSIIIIGTVGHYYLHSLIEYGNPFYPYKVTILNIGFNSSAADYSKTSIMSSIHDKRVWQDFFSIENFFPSGILFPVFLTFGVGGTFLIICYFVYKYVKTRQTELSIVFLSIFILISWFVYFFNYASASNDDRQNLEYLQNLVSLRYVEGPLFLTELFLVYVLWKLKTPMPIILSVIGANLISRLVYLYPQLPSYLDYRIAIYPIVIMGVAILIRKYLQPKSAFVIFSVAGVCIFIFAPQVVEANVSGWAWWWEDVISQVRNFPPSEIYLISNPQDTFLYSWPVQYPVSGNLFQHSIKVGSQNELVQNLQNSTVISGLEPKSYPDYIVQLCNPNINCTKELGNLNSTVSKYGYVTATMNDHSILLKLNQ